MGRYFSFARLFAIFIKEFRQLRRDRLTFAMIIGLPLIQLILFGYAINMNPRHLPTAIVAADNSVFTRSIIRGMKNTNYFKIIGQTRSFKEGDKLLAQGKALFVLNIPPDFSWKLARNLKPQLLLEADATDPVAIGQALSAMQVLQQTILNADLTGPMIKLVNPPFSIKLITHEKYNPEKNTQFNIVPALLGVILTMTMVIITSMALTRERERGTMESLLSTPVKASEVLIGKVMPYILVGYIQFTLILLMSYYLFHVPINGSLTLLFIVTLPFIAANLVVGIMFSSLVKNQMQAMQSAFFFFLPSILLSGFMFPFPGMPQWAQYIGEILPLTHYVRIVRGIMLKGNNFFYIWPEVWPILLFTLLVLTVGIKRFRKTLD